MANNITWVTDETFSSFVDTDKPVLLDFYADWCGPCKILSPVLEEVASDFDGSLQVAKLNVDENPETARQFGIMSIPTMIVFKGGQPVKQLVGYMPKENIMAELSGIL
ncbi:thioredoxin [Alicyclobacillus dauci]|uniref:Thioredoxin n=1 Tax=Alicyclobacillus dauci TaxID=1475485 RepID=A0ABY6Z3V4_9BACL|nr:thioredoxin [Alicyclobacillus dauci]WAH37564.1 thioredoxin [Alicyclobacillus dauci]